MQSYSSKVYNLNLFRNQKVVSWMPELFLLLKFDF